MSRDPEFTLFKPGDRVKYRYDHLVGVILRPHKGKGGDWWVRWDEHGELPAFDSNLLFEVLNAD